MKLTDKQTMLFRFIQANRDEVVLNDLFIIYYIFEKKKLMEMHIGSGEAGASLNLHGGDYRDGARHRRRRGTRLMEKNGRA